MEYQWRSGTGMEVPADYSSQGYLHKYRCTQGENEGCEIRTVGRVTNEAISIVINIISVTRYGNSSPSSQRPYFLWDFSYL